MLTEEERRSIVSETTEHIIRMLPDIISNLITQASILHTMKTDFFKKNPDLKDRPDVVGQIIEELELKNPGGNVQKLFESAGPLARNRLKELKLTGTRPAGRNLDELDQNLNGVI
jgi:hypothetical protein